MIKQVVTTIKDAAGAALAAAFMVFTLLCGFSAPAFAQCASPAAAAGAIEYFTGTSEYKLCDGTTWNVIELDTASGSACSQAAAREWDGTDKTYKVCNGTNYKKVNCAAASAPYCSTTLDKKLIASDGADGDNFGITVSISGDTAVIGADTDDVGANTNQGSAYVFVRSGDVWTQQAQLVASDGTSSSFFGYSTAISGDTVVVGTQLKEAIYVFTRSGTTWSEQAKLTASDGVNGDSFGETVSISGDTIVAGARLDDIGANGNQGSAYVFTRSGTTWSEQAKLTASDGVATDGFGRSVSISGNTMIVGSSDDVGANVDQGSAYIFTRSGTTWSEQAKLTASDGAAYDYFSYSVAVSGDTAAIGAYRNQVGSNAQQGSVYIFTRSGTTWSEQTQLTASDGQSGDWFGSSVAISGDAVIVGSRLDDVGSNVDQGSAYVFMRSGSVWTEQSHLTAYDGAENDLYGMSVSVSGDTAIIGANTSNVGINDDQGSAYIIPAIPQKVVASDAQPDDFFGNAIAISSNTAVISASRDTITQTNQGSAYVFTQSGGVWTQQTKLVASDAAQNDFMGSSVSIDDNTVIIGAPSDSVGSNTDQGSAYVFTGSGSTWNEQAKLTASDGLSFDGFGESVHLTGDTAIIGAQLDDIGANANQGSAYVFTRSGGTWTQQTKLTASDGTVGDFFGKAVAIYGDTAIVGASSDDIGANTDQGSAYVFTQSGGIWTQQAKLTASDGAASDFFGTSVAISDNTIAIGTPGDDSSKGSVYIFTGSGSTWTQQAKLTASDGATSDYFGYRVSLSGDSIFIGAPYDDVGTNTDQGSAYIFIRSGSIWGQASKLTAASGSFGYSVAFDGNIGAVGAISADTTGAAFFVRLDLSTLCSYTQSQQKGTAQTKTSTTSWTALSSVSLNTGDTLLTCIATKGDNVTGVTWNGTAMTQSVVASSTTAKAYIYALPNVTAGTGNIVVSISGATTSGKALTATSVANLSSTPLDKSANATGSSDTPSSGATATTAQADEFLYGCIASNGPNEDNPGSWSEILHKGQRLGSTGAGATSNMTANEGYRGVSATGAYTAKISNFTSRDWAAAIATYKANTSNSCQTYGTCSAEAAMEYLPGNGMRYCNGTNWNQIKAP